MPASVSEIQTSLDRAMFASPQSRPRLITRLRVALQRPALDGELADGVDPVASPALAFRAAQLTSDRKRERISATIARVLAEAERSPSGWSAAVPVNREELAESRSLLIQIEATLQSEQPVYCQGMAMLQRLLTDGASPLYGRSSKGALNDELERVIAALQGR